MWIFDKDYVSSLESLILTPGNTANTSVNYDSLIIKPTFQLGDLPVHYQVLTCSIHDEAVNNSK